jgi:hypothetical protein
MDLQLTTTTATTGTTDVIPEMTLTKQELWIDNVILWEYIPDERIIKATLECPRLEERAETHKARMKKAGKPAPATIKDALRDYYIRYDKKKKAKQCVMGRAKHGFGRAFVRDDKSFANMERYCRNTLTNKYYIDFDIANAQLNIINQILLANGYTDHEALTFYCENRDKCLEKWMKKFKLTRDQAKDLATQVIFGAEKVPYGCYDDVLIEMFTERDAWVAAFKEANPKLYESARQSNMAKEKRQEKQHENTMIAWIGQEYETRVVSACLEFCDREGLLNVAEMGEMKVGSYIYDGFMLWGENCVKYGGHKLLSAFNQIGFDATGLDLDWTIKSHHDECYEITEIYMDLMKDTEEKAAEPEMSFEEYSAIFEKTHCKIVKGGLYVKKDEEGIEIMDEKTLTASYKDLWCGWTLGRNPEKKSWIKQWTTNNEHIKKYARMDTYPDTTKCPDNVFNLWRPYAMERVRFCEFNQDCVDFMKSHITEIICDGGKPQATYLLDWISHIIQFPDLKTKKCPILLSKGEGTGKSSLIRMLEKMLGKEKVWEPQKPDRDVWGAFNGNLLGKTIVVLNEISQYQTDKSMGEIKHYITEPKISIRAMRTEAQEMSDYANYIATTNDEKGGFNISEDTRRFWMLRVSDKRLGDTEYFNKFYGFLEDSNCVKSLYQWFKSREITSNFDDPKATPITEYQRRIAESNRSNVETFLESYVRSNWEKEREGNSTREMTSTDVLTLYREFCAKNGEKWEKGAGSAAGLSMKLNNSDISDKAKATSSEKRRDGSYRLFDIDKMLAYFVGKGTMRYEEFKGATSSALVVAAADQVEEED